MYSFNMAKETNEKKSLSQRYREASASKILLTVVQPLIAEFFTMILHTFWGSMAAATTEPIVYVNLNRTVHPEEWSANYVTSALMPAFQAGFAVWMFIVVYWKICVINFNPAISTGLLVSGVLSPWKYIPFMVLQSLGSIVGALLAQAMKGDSIGPFLISNDANKWAIFGCEFITTGCMVFFTVAMLVDKTYDQATGPLAIGITVFQGILAGRWIGAGCLNPARAIGPAVVLGGSVWDNHWIWWIGDLSGAAFFAAIYMCFFAPADKVWMIKVSDWLKSSSNTNTNETMRINEDSRRSQI